MKHAEFVLSQGQFKEFLFSFVAEFVAHVFIFEDFEHKLKKMILEDSVFNRALEFSNCIFVIDDLLGRETKSLEKWIMADSKEYMPIARGSFLKDTIPILDGEKVEKNKFTVHYGAPENFEPEDINHNDIEIDDLINIPLWDQAKWRGMMFAITPDPNVPSILAPIFTDKSPGITIFKKWILDFGPLDSKNNIRCCVIKGVDKDNPTYYKFAFSPNIDINHSSQAKHQITYSRFRLMESITMSPLSRQRFSVC
ncbi:MAG TPA: hypothetical protein VFC84_15485 [Desulfosporosinus sp.]|nr:hypothetical protein [Desulfosporosinus sp.]